MNLLKAIKEQTAAAANPKLMLEFLTGIVQGVREEIADPQKKDWKYHCFEEILLEFGQFIQPQQAQQIGYPDYCFYNCQALVFQPENADATYFEGYAFDPVHPIPTRHAWITLPKTGAIDPTWEKLSSCYFGVAIATEWLRELELHRKAEEIEIRQVFSYECPHSVRLLVEGIPEGFIRGN